MTKGAAIHELPVAKPPPRRCVGREAELAALDACLERAMAGTSCFVLATGEPGAGKSTLLQTAQQRFRDAGALVLSASCQPGLTSYRPLFDVVRAAVEFLCEQHVEDPAGERLLQLLGGRAAQPAEIEHTADERLRFFDDMAQLLTRVSRVQPLVVVLHDIDLADPATRQLVVYLARVLASSPLLAAADFRGMLLASTVAAEGLDEDPRWSEGVELVHLDVGGLSAAGVRAYLSSDQVVERVFQATRGLPPLIEALVSQPPREALSPLQQVDAVGMRVLRLLAVMGRALGPETLRLLTRLPHSGLARAISALGELGVIEKAVTDGELRVGFCRAGDQQTIYESIEPQELRALHAQVGEHLRRLGDETEIEAAAHHLLLGGCGERAVAVALQAAQRLEISFCHERAASLYERALEQTSTDAVRVEIIERLSTLNEAAGRLDRALDHAQRLSELSPGSAEHAVRVARLQILNGEYAAALAALGGIRDELDRSAGELWIRVLAYTAEAHYLAGDLDAGLERAREALALCADDDPTLDRHTPLIVRRTMAAIYLDRGKYEEARPLLVTNLEQAERAGLEAQAVAAMIQLGLTHLKSGDHREAERCYQRAHRLAHTVGAHRYMGICQQHLGVLAERRRDYKRAIDCYQAAVNIWKKMGHRNYLAWIGLDLGKLYLDLGDVDRASAMVTLADRLADTEPPVATRINLEILRGRVAQQQCRFREAAERFDRARELAHKAGHDERETRALLHTIELLIQRGDGAQAEALLGRAGLPARGPCRLKALLLRAQLRESTGDLESARMDLAEALELSEQLDDLEAAWEAQFHLGLLARRQGRSMEGRRLLQEAAEIEQRVRERVPQEFHQHLGEQGRRAALRHAVAESGGSSPTAAVAEAAPETRLAKAPRRRGHAEIVGEHARMRQVLDQVDKVGPTDARVLLRGESGTGKELVADAIHRRSHRANRSLVKVNCGALVESLLLSELFGHERGAFTGATQRRTGRFELADGGTIFLDEIGDISPKTQVALLRVLQEGTFERVGGTAPIKVDVRLICATNRDLEAMVAAGEFREDLYYRLRGVQIELPALRQRVEDIPLLAEHILQRLGEERGVTQRLTEAARDLLCGHDWPGNVRELENVLRSVSLFAEGERLDVGDFAEYAELGRATGARSTSAAPTRLDIYEQMRSDGCSLREMKKKLESECIQRALAEAGGNITKAADLLGMKRPRLSQLIKELGLAVR